MLLANPHLQDLLATGSVSGGDWSEMARAQSFEVRLCEECGQPIDRGRGNVFLCRRCERLMDHRKRKGEPTRRSRRDSRRAREADDW
jgi:hypothetical protein